MMNEFEREQEEETASTKATHGDAMREYAENVGHELACKGNSRSAWILTPFDVWQRNPYWDGTGSGRHPESDYE